MQVGPICAEVHLHIARIRIYMKDRKSAYFKKTRILIVEVVGELRLVSSFRKINRRTNLILYFISLCEFPIMSL